MGEYIGLIKGDTRSLDCSSYEQFRKIGASGTLIKYGKTSENRPATTSEKWFPL